MSHIYSNDSLKILRPSANNEDLGETVRGTGSPRPPPYSNAISNLILCLVSIMFLTASLPLLRRKTKLICHI